jgi:hypothetical protein
MGCTPKVAIMIVLMKYFSYKDQSVKHDSVNTMKVLGQCKIINGDVVGDEHYPYNLTIMKYYRLPSENTYSCIFGFARKVGM